jgi:hypothetical protein
MSDSLQRMFPNGATVCRMYGGLDDGECIAAFSWIEPAKEWAQQQLASKRHGDDVWFAVACTSSGKVWAYRNVPEKKP